MQYDMKKSGAHIKNLRIRNGYTQGELAKMLRVDRSFLSCIESGKKGCSVDLLVQLSGIFCVSLDYLVFGTVCSTQAGDRENLKVEIAKLIDHLELIKGQL